MKTVNVICPDCGGKKDRRAKRCHPCRMDSEDHPRLGKGKDWSVHIGTGYVAKCISGKWTFQHRHVMEKHLGRKLDRTEHVHHIDGDKTNNVLENLEVLLGSEHRRRHMPTDFAKTMSIAGHKARWGYVPHL